MKCSSCGAEIKEGAEFCVVCGKKLPKRKKCPKCGSEVLEEVLFCTNCGNKFEQPVAEEYAYYAEEDPSTSRILKWVIAILIVLLLGVGAFFYFYLMPQMPSSHFSVEISDSAHVVNNETSNSDSQEQQKLLDDSIKKVQEEQRQQAIADSIAHAKKKEAASSASTEKVFTIVGAISDDGFVNVRVSPSSNARVVDKVYEFFHGLGNAMVLGYSGNWTKVVCCGNGKVGYAYSKYLGEESWYSPNDRQRIVATCNARIYGEDYSGERGMPVEYVVKPGTIIASEYEDNGEYYVLPSGHDNLYVRKQDVKVVYRK